MRIVNFIVFVFFFNDTATTEIYTLSLHDALPIYDMELEEFISWIDNMCIFRVPYHRSEEHTSELQSLTNLVCRLLLEKRKYDYVARMGGDEFAVIIPGLKADEGDDSIRRFRQAVEVATADLGFSGVSFIFLTKTPPRESNPLAPPAILPI